MIRFYVHGLKELVLFKMPILPKSYIVFSVIPVKIPMASFTEAEKIILTFV